MAASPSPTEPPQPTPRRVARCGRAACPTGRSPGCSSRRRSLLLLAINIFPLIWTIWLSFTNYRANRPNAPIALGRHRQLPARATDPDIWHAMQATAHFVFWSIVLQTAARLRPRLSDRPRFRGHGFWTTADPAADDAVAGGGRQLLDVPLQPQIGLFNYVVAFFTGIAPSLVHRCSATSQLAPWAIIMVDTWMWTPYVMLICLAGLRSIPDYIYEAAEVDRASPWRQFWSITLPMVLPFIMLAVLFRGDRELQDVRHGEPADLGGPGSTTELASITLKREAFEKWRTGYSSAFAIILFVTVFGLPTSTSRRSTG